MVDGPITLPPVDLSLPNAATVPRVIEQRRTTQSESRRGGYQSDKARETRQRGHVNELFDWPARILPSQQGTGPLQQGTGTSQTIGGCAAEARAGLPLQRGTVLNQTANISLQQGTGTNPTIGIPQVRPSWCRAPFSRHYHYHCKPIRRSALGR